jgi:hypothetical protein
MDSVALCEVQECRQFDTIVISICAFM